ncbi:MAG TPA: hypothetical protein DCX07_09730 [Phycisphaerales bacterium]|nr:hypothetical protein [Phycisphaerales bacterium]
MIFYVYIDPGVFDVAQTDGPYAVQVLIGTLRGFVQNCCVMEFDDRRIQDAIGEKVRALPPSHERKALMSLLTVLAKRNRFVYCIAPDYAGAKSDTDTMLEQAAGLLIDLALVGAPVEADAVIPATVQVALLREYQNTFFESERSKIASEGRTTAPGELSEADFLDVHFKKAFRYAARIDICDKLFGRKYGDNYKYTAERMIRWLGGSLSDRTRCKLVFHCAKPEGMTDQYMQQTLRQARDAHAAGLPVEVQFYQLPTGDSAMPHERFVQTDQVALGIDRGMDFLDAGTRSSRDVFVSYKGLPACAAVLKTYSGGRLPVMVV